MIKFEVPYNFEPNFFEKFLERKDLFEYIECFYVAAWKDDCDNTRQGATFREEYPKTYEEYVEHIRKLQSLGIEICVLAQKGATMEMVEKYIGLGIKSFTINDDELATKIKKKYPDVKLTLSITRALSVSDINEHDLSMYDLIVLFHWFGRHLDAIQGLPTKYKYAIICNTGCYYDCKCHDAHWFIKKDTLEEYYDAESDVCRLCHELIAQNPQTGSGIEPEDLEFFDPYISVYKLTDRTDHTELIVDNLNAYVNRFRGVPRGRDYYNIEENEVAP